MPFVKRRTGEHYRGAKMLTREEERHLFQRWREGGDESAHAQLCKSIMPWAQRLAIKFCERRCWNNTDGAISAAYLGVLLATRKFDVAKNCRLTTYASWWIKQSLQREWRYDRIIHIPIDVLQGRRKVPWNVPFAAGDTMDDECPSIRHDPWQAQLDSEQAVQNKAAIEFAMAKLPERHRTILQLRAFNNLTLQKIGEQIGVTKERVRQIEKIAMAGLARHVNEFFVQDKFEAVA